MKGQSCTSLKKEKLKQLKSPVKGFKALESPSRPVQQCVFLNPFYYIPLPEDLSPPPAGKYHDFYCVTVGQECGIYLTW